MTVDNLSDLKKIILLCRKQGVTAIEIDGIKLDLSLAPTTTKRVHKPLNIELPPEATMAVPQYTPEKIEVEGWDSLSEEEKVFYSSRPQDTN